MITINPELVPPTLSKQEALEAIHEMKYFQDQLKKTVFNFVLNHPVCLEKNKESIEISMLQSMLNVY